MITNAKDGASQSDIVDVIGIGHGQWDVAINELPAQGVITKTGAARGTRDYLAERGGSA